jgi:outer membrane protein assembly factor BamD
MILFVAIIILVAGCAKNKAQMSNENKLALADQLFAAKKYTRAIKLYEEISYERKSAATAKAVIRQAEGYFNINKFTDSRLKYTQFTSMFPDHADVATAYYRIGVCYYEESLGPQYDQSETSLCIEALRLFIEKFPSDKRYSEALDYIRKAQYKLIEKKYYNGYIYYKMHDYSAALMYFQEVVELGNQDKIDKKSLYYTTLLLIKQGNMTVAESTFNSMKAKYPGAKETKRLSKYFR